MFVYILWCLYRICFLVGEQWSPFPIVCISGCDRSGGVRHGYVMDWTGGGGQRSFVLCSILCLTIPEVGEWGHRFPTPVV